MRFVDRSIRDFYKGSRRAIELEDAEAIRLQTEVEQHQAAWAQQVAAEAKRPPQPPPRTIRWMQIVGWLALIGAALGWFWGSVLAVVTAGRWPLGGFAVTGVAWVCMPVVGLVGLGLVLFADRKRQRKRSRSTSHTQALAPQPARRIVPAWTLRVLDPGWQGRAGTTGEAGERRLYDYLQGHLNGDYYGITGLSLTPRSDIDLIVVGPTGVWVLDSKYWSDMVSFEGGEWRRFRRVGRLGYEDWRDERVTAPPDIQIQRECLQVAGAIADGTGWPFEDVCDMVRGVIVFTHSYTHLYKRHTFPVAVEELTPELIRRLTDEDEKRILNPDEVLSMIEALCNRDLESQGRRQSGVALAEELAQA